MSLVVRVLLILVLIWLVLNVFGDFLNIISNSLFLAVLAIIAILWYLDYI